MNSTAYWSKKIHDFAVESGYFVIESNNMYATLESKTVYVLCGK
jgi:hypothetical protein